MAEGENAVRDGCMRCHKWLVFLSAAFAMVIDTGFIFSSGALFVDIMGTFNANRSQAALVQSVVMAVRYLAGMFSGALVQRFGALKAGVFGSCIAAFGLIVSFFSTSVLYLVFSMGLCVATGSSSLFIASSVVVGQYFQGKTRLILIAAQNAAGGLGGMLYPFILENLSDTFGLRGTLLIVGGFYMQVLPAALLWTSRVTHAEEDKIKVNETDQPVADKSERQNVKQTKRNNDNVAQTTRKSDECFDGERGNQQMDLQSDEKVVETETVVIERKITVVDEKKENEENNFKVKPGTVRKETAWECLKELAFNSSFVFFALGLGVLYPALGILFIFIVDLFLDAGLTEEQASLGLLLVHMCSIFGRLLPGLVMQSRRIATLSVPIAAAVVTAAAMVGLAFIPSLELALFLCCLIGIPFGTLTSVFSVTSVELVGINRLSNAIGVLFTLNAFGSALAGPVSGLFRDSIGSYKIPFLIATGFVLIGAILFCISLQLRRTHKHYITERTTVRQSGNERVV